MTDTDEAMKTRPALSLVIPVYKNEPSIGPLLEALENVNKTVPGELEVVFVVDGSPDASHGLLAQALPSAGFSSVLIELSRNFGSFAAIRQGLLAASGDYFAVMAADLQEPPELVTDFFKALVAAEADVVLGERVGRSDPWLTRFTSASYWRIYKRLIQNDMPEGGVDVFGCNKAVRDALVEMNEAHSSLVGLLIWSGFTRVSIPYERREREYGRSSWTFGKRISYMMDSAFSFSDLPIRLLLATGLTGFLAMILVTVVVVVGWMLGWVQVPGYTPVMLAALISASLIIFALGIVGAYVWRTYENTKERPSVLVRTVHHQVRNERND